MVNKLELADWKTFPLEHVRDTMLIVLACMTGKTDFVQEKSKQTSFSATFHTNNLIKVAIPAIQKLPENKKVIEPMTHVTIKDKIILSIEGREQGISYHITPEKIALSTMSSDPILTEIAKWASRSLISISITKKEVKPIDIEKEFIK